ncbi:hypothetical protein AAFF_G00432960 [Aldrovandia affinis]|uniref:Uncharacterized protein n=1 Tax=Aldrovandia affinis TaxID=143900 RepID=A0AAD7WJ47_9TELE|nr:hypothetical protein AAFF_G00432960 [Aldrovandia affinis]
MAEVSPTGGRTGMEAGWDEGHAQRGIARSSPPLSLSVAVFHAAGWLPRQRRHRSSPYGAFDPLTRRRSAGALTIASPGRGPQPRGAGVTPMSSRHSSSPNEGTEERKGV